MEAGRSIEPEVAEPGADLGLLPPLVHRGLLEAYRQKLPGRECCRSLGTSGELCEASRCSELLTLNFQMQASES